MMKKHILITKKNFWAAQTSSVTQIKQLQGKLQLFNKQPINSRYNRETYYRKRKNCYFSLFIFFWHIYHFETTLFMCACCKFNLRILLGQYVCDIKDKDNNQLSTI